MERTRDRHGHHRTLEIEFIGGPYDGYKEIANAPPIHLPAQVVWLVCEDAFRLLDGEDHRSRGSFTSVALYEREVGNGKPIYFFAGAFSLSELTNSMHGTSN